MDASRLIRALRDVGAGRYCTAHAAPRHLSPYSSFHSSYQAIWIASRIFSLDCSGLPSKSSRSRTHLCRSVKRTVSGLRVSYFSKSSSPICRESCQFRPMMHLRAGRGRSPKRERGTLLPRSRFGLPPTRFSPLLWVYLFQRPVLKRGPNDGVHEALGQRQRRPVQLVEGLLEPVAAVALHGLPHRLRRRLDAPPRLGVEVGPLGFEAPGGVPQVGVG